MRVITPGHKYALPHLDGEGEEIITFVQREGAGYPGNVGHYSGTNLQELWRACIHRLIYLNHQKPHWATQSAIQRLRGAILDLETRAAERYGRKLRLNPHIQIEDEKTCSKCGHIGCLGDCPPDVRPL
jgi:hypothetical protein